MEIEITNINDSDLINCAKLYVAIFREYPWNEDWSMEVALERLSDLLNIPKPVALKITYDGKLCGFLIGRIQRWTGETSCYIEEICISHSMQRQGVGRRLMGELEEILKVKGVSGVSLVTQRNSGPFNFYSALEFKEDYRLVFMRKKLG